MQRPRSAADSRYRIHTPGKVERVRVPDVKVPTRSGHAETDQPQTGSRPRPGIGRSDAAATSDTLARPPDRDGLPFRPTERAVPVPPRPMHQPMPQTTRHKTLPPATTGAAPSRRDVPSREPTLVSSRAPAPHRDDAPARRTGLERDAWASKPPADETPADTDGRSVRAPAVSRQTLRAADDKRTVFGSQHPVSASRRPTRELVTQSLTAASEAAQRVIDRAARADDTLYSSRPPAVSAEPARSTRPSEATRAGDPPERSGVFRDRRGRTETVFGFDAPTPRKKPGT